MKEVKNRSSSDANILQKHSQATEEQLRVAKLSQLNSKEDHHIQEKIKEVSDITLKPPDIVSIALHDCNYDTSLAIQNIFEGKYEEEQDEWKTTNTKKGRKLPGGSSNTTTTGTTNHNDISNNHSEVLDKFEDSDEKPSNKFNNISRGGGMTGQRGRSNSRGKREDRFVSEEKWDTVQEKGNRSNRSSDRGNRARGRGRGANRGGGRGGRGGFGRGGGGSMRGTSRSRGTDRGIGGGRRPRENRNREENGFGEPNEVVYSGGFGDPPKDDTESWDLEIDTATRTESWGDDIPESNNVDWSKDSWGDEPVSNDHVSGSVDSLFMQHKVDWSQMNGNKDKEEKWDEDTTANNATAAAGKYLPEQVDAAVICSIPTSATSSEVTSYQPTNDITRYINNSASNQFPSSQQEGGLTNSLNEREFNLSNVSDSSKNNNINMPMVSGITESHKLEQEQLRAPKPVSASQQDVLPPGHTSNRAVTQQQKARKSQSKSGVSLPSQPVVMPRSAHLMNDESEQFAGLEFGSPASPRGGKKSNSPSTLASANHHDVSESSLKRQPVATMENSTSVSSSKHELLSQSSSSLLSKQPPITSSQLEASKLPNDVMQQKDVSHTLNAFKPLDQPELNSHFIGSPNRGLGHGIVAEPIPFPSSTTLSSPTSSSSLDMFARHSGLGTNVTMSKQQQQQQKQQQSLSSYRDKRDKVYNDHEKNANTHEKNVNAEKILAEQKALAEKQYLVEQQRVLTEQQREKAMTEQRAFAEQKALAQQKLLASQRSTEEMNSRSESATNNLQDSRKTLADQRLGLSENNPVHSVKETKTENTYTSKAHRATNPRSISSPPGLSSSVYTSNVSKKAELLNQNTANASPTSKGPSKVSSAPPGMIHPNLLYTTGVQPGLVPTYQHQLHGYNYDELLQLQRLQMSQSPYHYDVSPMYPPSANAAAAAAREGMQNYPANDSKFQRGNEESAPGNLHQANAHVASNLNPHQAYLNAPGQLPYGFTYAFQPGVMPQAGIYPAFTAPNVFQLNQAKGVVGTQYQSQYAGQQGFNTGKYSGAGSHEFSKGNFHNSGSSQTTMSGGKGNQQNSMNSSDSTPSIQSGGQFKGQGYNDAKSFLATSPSSMTSQPTMAMHGQAAHMNPYLLQQQQQHTSLLTGPVSANHLGHQGSLDNRNTGGHPVAFGGNQQKRDVNKGSYHSYWSGNR